jgi:hypothetical protein
MAMIENRAQVLERVDAAITTDGGVAAKANTDEKGLLNQPLVVASLPPPLSFYGKAADKDMTDDLREQISRKIFREVVFLLALLLLCVLGRGGSVCLEGGVVCAWKGGHLLLLNCFPSIIVSLMDTSPSVYIDRWPFMVSTSTWIDSSGCRF